MPVAPRISVAVFLAAIVFVSAAMALTGPSRRSTSGTATLTVASSQFGRIIFDGRHRALYAFTRDSRGQSRCQGDCAAKWPPYVVRGRVQAGAGVQASLLSTIRRPDGTRQVAYAGRPLYHYIGDPPGKVLCGNVSEFGGLWLVIAPSGRLVR